MQLREKSKRAMEKKRIIGIRKQRSGEMERRGIITAEVKGEERSFFSWASGWYKV